jgi:hypothetical protein
VGIGPIARRRLTVSDRSTPAPSGRPGPEAADAFGHPLRSGSPAGTARSTAVAGDDAVAVPAAAPPGSPVATPTGTADAPAPPSSATLALLLGIAGLVIFPVLLSVPAWVVGVRARRESRALPGRPGYGMATTGWLLGILGTIGWVIVGLLLLYVLWLIGSSEIPYD